MLKQNKIVVKKFLLSIKNAVMAMSVETLKESSIQEILDNFRAMNTLKDSGFDMDSPIIIKVGERKEIKVLPSFVGDMGEDDGPIFPHWEFTMGNPDIVGLSVQGNSVYIQGLSEGRTMINGIYETSMDDSGEESSIEVVVEGQINSSTSPASPNPIGNDNLHPKE